jgi:GT2 family glycosyltransferase
VATSGGRWRHVSGSRPTENELVASVVVSTYNRADALAETLETLARQDLAHDRYEVIVADDGSTDHTWSVLEKTSTPYSLKAVRHEKNRGVSAGRNSGIHAARGRNLIFVSDDVLTPPNFIRRHVEMLERMPGYWVVGAFRQRDSLTDTPFGRYLDELEREFERARKSHEIAPGLWEMTWPTARNLSLPRADIQRIGLFDERFRTTCEDQDLAERARRVGIRFVYATEIDCLHNDQTADLARYCNFQERGARDTVALCAKTPELHGAAPITRVNGPISRTDGVPLVLKKMVKSMLVRRCRDKAVAHAVGRAEHLPVPEPLLRRGYRLAISLAIFRGWRAGLAAQTSDKIGE